MSTKFTVSIYCSGLDSSVKSKMPVLNSIYKAL